MNQSKTHHLSGAQTAGWIIWWLTSVTLVGLGLIMIFFSEPSFRKSSIFWIAFGIFAVIYLIQQIIAAFAIKNLHKNNAYVWPIVLIVLALLGSFIYIIPGIWALIVNNPMKNHSDQQQ
jgi:cytochrome bd-type quinol oxidase subunit 2